MAFAGILIGVGQLVTHSDRVQGFDNHVTSIVIAHRSVGLNVVMKAVTWLGSWVAVLTATAVIVVLILRRTLSVGFFVLAALLWAGTQGATTLAKQVVQRPRPPENLRLVTAHGWSWPSGHTTTATLVFAILATVIWAVTSKVGLRILAVFGWIVFVAAVAFSRVELGVHWTTDVLASVVFVAGWLVAAGALFGRPPRRHASESNGSASAKA
jgi:undecaprenyl-diphosphatase